MKELDLSIMSRTPQAVEELKSLLNVFESRHNIKINLQVLTWDTGRSELIKTAMYHHGAEISEVGSTWVGDLISMNALRPFSASDIAVLGGREPILPAAWDRTRLIGDSRTLSVPWTLDLSAVFYRRDLFQQAGIDESTAFQTIAQFEQTLERVKSSGIRIPWVMPKHKYRYINVHFIASWIWASGGDLLSPDGKRVLFDQPEALSGMRSYFSLFRYLSPEAFDQDDQAYEILFSEGKAAVKIGLIAQVAPDVFLSPEVRKNISAASLLGVPFVGGSNLVVWKHVRNEEAALALVNFLGNLEVQNRYCRAAYILPVRLESLAALETTSDPVLHSLSVMAGSGRSFPCASLWGLVEDKLDNALSQIWKGLLEEPTTDLDELIRKNIIPLANRLNVTLGQGGRK
jgi:multiple sugar transport system substrate-binding protein